MDILNNLDLLSVGVAIAGIGILGFVVYFNNKDSVTNRSFLYFSIATILWGIVNYSSYQFSNETVVLWLFRFIMFFAVFQAFFLYRLFQVFPKKEFEFSERHRKTLVPIVIITAITTLTPYLFSNLTGDIIAGEVAQVAKGPGLFLFAFVSIGLVLRGLYLFLRRTWKSGANEQKSFIFILIGTFIMFGLIIAFNFILPAFYNKPKYISLGAVFIIPFVAFTSYAILKHKLFDIKVVATATLTFVLSIVTFLEIIFSQGLNQIMFRSSVFVLVLVFSIFLLKSVRKEVTQREEIQKLAKTLEKANVRLKELDKMKSEFVSFATHQIRAPITAIKGYTSLILEGSYGDVSNKMKEAVRRIHKSSDSLAIVVEDYLNISRIEMGTMKYDFKVLDLGKLLKEVTQELKHIVINDGLEFKVNIDESKEYKVKVDEGKVRQVITNIIDNSVKYTDEGYLEVSIEKYEKKGKVRVKISDSGVGIKKQTMSKLFKKFSRAKDANETNIHGTGLGLYIAKQMIQAHGGRLWAESEGENMGAQFYIEVDAI